MRRLVTRLCLLFVAVVATVGLIPSAAQATYSFTLVSSASFEQGPQARGSLLTAYMPVAVSGNVTVRASGCNLNLPVSFNNGSQINFYYPNSIG
jgi:hypothetical protein